MTNKTLEEIFWRDGKFIKNNGEEVKPEAVGEAQIIKIKTSELYKEELKNSLSELLEALKFGNKKYEEVNAFSRGDRTKIDCSGGLAFMISYGFTTCNFYKI